MLQSRAASVTLPTDPVIIAVGALYFLICGAIALWALRQTRSAGDFFLAGRRLGPWTLAISVMATTLSGFIFIGGPGLLYSVGSGALFISLSAAITTPLSAWVLGLRMRLLGEARSLLTVPDAIRVRYRSPRAQGLAAVAILVAIVGYVATNFLALGLVVDALFHTGRMPGIVIGAVAVLAYSATGGILAGVYTDVFQGLVMAAASVLVFLAALHSGGGMAEISRTILSHDPGLLGPWGSFSPLAALSLFFVFGLGTLGQPHVLHKYYMLRDVVKFRWYPLMMTVALLVSLLLFLGVGLAVRARVLAGDLSPLASPDDATPTFLLRYTSPWLAGLVFSGVAAAIMSTVNSFLNVGAAAIMHDLPRSLGRPVGDELRTGRRWTVVLAVLATALALLSGSLVVFLGIFGWGLFASTLVPSLAIGLNWPGATRAGAEASIAVGLVGTLVLESLSYFRIYRFPTGVSIAGLMLVVSLLTFVIVSWVTGRRAAEDLDPDVRMIMEV